MRKLVTAVAVLFISVQAFAAIPIRPTTTLAEETSNNTSAAGTFKTQSNGNIGARNISKLPIRNLLYSGATTKIYVHLMPWFGPSNHIDVGYESADPAQVKRQVEDMISRGIDGAIVDWYGPTSTHHNTATLNLMQEAELHPGFEFAITEDVGSVKSASNPQQKLIDDLNYVNRTFSPSSAYMRRAGRPVVFFFGLETLPTPIDWNAVRAAVEGNPLFIFRNSGGFTAAQTNGGFSWLATQTTVTPGYMSLEYLNNFYSTAQNYPSHETFGSGFKGFDDSIASWGQKRKINQFCGQTWLASMAHAGTFYSSANQLENLQLVTWNDYEEGSELETGIDNCVSIAASLQGSTLAWTINGSEDTIDHYKVFISLDGQNLMPLADAAVGNRSMNLQSFDLTGGAYTLHVKAVGKPSIVNQMSNALTFSTDLEMTVSPASLMIKQGQSGTFTVRVMPRAASFDRPVSFSCSGLPAQHKCSFSPTTVTPGANSATSALTISTSAIAQVKPPARGNGNAPLYAVCLSGAGIAGLVVGSRKPGHKVRSVMLGAVIAVALLQAACGSSGASRTSPSVSTEHSAIKSGTFSVVITATSGSEQLSTAATVVVQ